MAPQVFRLNQRSAIEGRVHPQILQMAKSHGIKIMPLVVNSGFDQELIHRFLQDQKAQSYAMNALLNLCKQYGFWGIQFDFEHIPAADQDLFTAFVKETSDKLHQHGFLLSVAVFPRTGDQPLDDPYHRWYYENRSGVYDYQALAQVVDFLSIMTYDQHTRHTPPGPVAGLPWMEKVLQYVLRKVPAQKISLGIPLYSYHWFPGMVHGEGRGTGRGLSHEAAWQLLQKFQVDLQWDADNAIFWTRFLHNDIMEYLFVEDDRSFKYKIKLAEKYGLRGFSAWRLGLEDPAIWKLIQ